MKSILRAVALSGILGMGAAAAQAQVSFSVGFGTGPAVIAVPASPGDGYIWTPGYYYGRVWVPGRWVFGGYGGSPYVGAYGGNYGRVDVRRYDGDDRRGIDRYQDRNQGRDQGRNQGRDQGRNQGRDQGRNVRGHDDSHRH
jgi:hypothetical protein